MSDKPKPPKPLAERLAELRGIDSRKLTRRFDWVCDWASYGLACWPLVKTLEYVGKLGILVVAITYIYPGCQQRKQAAEDSKKTRHYVAWQTINSATDKPGNAGRSDALQDLNKDGIKLDGVSLNGRAVITGPLDLSKASLTHADFSDGTYIGVDFSGANFYDSRWSNAVSENCFFTNASFAKAHFEESHFFNCDFDSADFSPILESGHSGFRNCNFAHVRFGERQISEFDYVDCNFAYADLNDVYIAETNQNGFLFCNLYGSTASPSAIKWLSYQFVTFTNLVSMEQWNHFLATGPKFERCGTNFIAWASNQFKVQGDWIKWSKENLSK